MRAGAWVKGGGAERESGLREGQARSLTARLDACHLLDGKALPELVFGGCPETSLTRLYPMPEAG